MTTSSRRSLPNWSPWDLDRESRMHLRKVLVLGRQHGENGSSANTTVQTPRIEFPSFDGTDPIAWLAQAEQYFLVHHIPMNDRVQLALIAMTGRSMFWAQWVLRRSAAITWTQLTRERNFEIEFQTLKRRDSGSAATYLFAQVGWGATAEVQFFSWVVLARSRPSATFQSPSMPESVQTQTGATTHSHSSSSASAPRGNHNTRHLTPAEVQEYRAKGKCYRCGERYSPLHKCTAKFLDAEEEISAEEERLDQEISPRLSNLILQSSCSNFNDLGCHHMGLRGQLLDFSLEDKAVLRGKQLIALQRSWRSFIISYLFIISYFLINGLSLGFGYRALCIMHGP
ncbi:hypothetical protein C2S52_006342 [Perilla frutescens var. hirtella]|nr:hypothetical protein C2S52_006342 [Perilla frutescens var. hirtella]